MLQVEKNPAAITESTFTESAQRFPTAELGQFIKRDVGSGFLVKQTVNDRRLLSVRPGNIVGRIEAVAVEMRIAPPALRGCFKEKLAGSALRRGNGKIARIPEEV